MTNIGGWIFTVASFACFYFYWKQCDYVKSDYSKSNYSKAILIAAIIAILSHHVLSALNVLYGPFQFTQFDAHSFHVHGIQRVDIPELRVWSIGSDIYKSLLGALYELFGKSLWMGQTFSILFFSMCCALMVSIAKIYKLNAMFCALAVLLYGLIPSSLLNGSFTLREPFFTGFFILGVLLSCKAIYANELGNRISQWQYYVLAVIAFLLMGIFHMVLLVYAVLISASLFLVLYAQQASWQKVIVQIILCIVAIVIIFYLIKHYLPIHLSDDYFAMLRVQIDGEVIPIPHAISLYHQVANATVATTQYDANLEFTSWTRMFFVLFYSYGFYLGWPVTGDYSQLTTWVLLSEALVRLSGILALFALLKQDKKWLWLLFVYVSITFLWNIGTSNHGQALRHHFMTEWIPVLALMLYLQMLCLQHPKWIEKIGWKGCK